MKTSNSLITFLLLATMLALPLAALAGGFELSVRGEPTRAGAIDFRILLGAAIDVLWVVFVGVVVVLLIVTGILFLTTHGDPEKIKKARMAFILSIIGIVVALLGYRMFATINCLINPSACVASCLPAGGACSADADCCTSHCNIGTNTCSNAPGA